MSFNCFTHYFFHSRLELRLPRYGIKHRLFYIRVFETVFKKSGNRRPPKGAVADKGEGIRQVHRGEACAPAKGAVADVGEGAGQVHRGARRDLVVCVCFFVCLMSTC